MDGPPSHLAAVSTICSKYRLIPRFWFPAAGYVDPKAWEQSWVISAPSTALYIDNDIVLTQQFREGRRAQIGDFVAEEGISGSDMRRNTPMFSPGLVAAMVVAYGIALFAPKVALAHAVLVSSQPTVNSTVSGPEVAVLLKYNSRIDMEHSTLTLLDPDGRVEKITIESEPSPGLLSAKLTGLVKGAYVLRWQVLATDGHITRGKVPFRVE